MYLRVPALTIIRHICHYNQKCSLPFAVLGWHGSSWECLQLGGENQNIFLLLGRLDKRRVVAVGSRLCALVLGDGAHEADGA